MKQNNVVAFVIKGGAFIGILFAALHEFRENHLSIHSNIILAAVFLAYIIVEVVELAKLFDDILHKPHEWDVETPSLRGMASVWCAVIVALSTLTAIDERHVLEQRPEPYSSIHVSV